MNTALTLLAAFPLTFSAADPETDTKKLTKAMDTTPIEREVQAQEIRRPSSIAISEDSDKQVQRVRR